MCNSDLLSYMKEDNTNIVSNLTKINSDKFSIKVEDELRPRAGRALIYTRRRRRQSGLGSFKIRYSFGVAHNRNTELHGRGRGDAG